jgi:hypothetical protein
MTKRTYPTVEHIQKVTQFKKKKQAQGALEALIWLDRGAPEKFDGLKGHFSFAMDTFISPISENYDDYTVKDMKCGTACCIAGAIWSFAKDMNGDMPKKNADMEDYFGTIEDEYGCSDLHPELRSLFYADDSYSLEDISAKQAAKTLRKYLKKGVVDWSHLE